MVRVSNRGMQQIHLIACTVIGIWTVFSVFAVAFQCGATRPWVYTPSRCAGQGAVWYPIIIINILTDCALAFLFAPIAWKLQMPLRQRVTVASLFSARILYVRRPFFFTQVLLTKRSVCAAAIAQIVLLAPALKAQDQTSKSNPSCRWIRQPSNISSRTTHCATDSRTVSLN